VYKADSTEAMRNVKEAMRNVNSFGTIRFDHGTVFLVRVSGETEFSWGWKDVTAGHESIGPNLILLKTPNASDKEFQQAFVEI